MAKVFIQTDEAMSPEEFAAAMRETREHWKADNEMMHVEADSLMEMLLETLGYGEGVDLFR